MDKHKYKYKDGSYRISVHQYIYISKSKQARILKISIKHFKGFRNVWKGIETSWVVLSAL